MGGLLCLGKERRGTRVSMSGGRAAGAGLGVYFVVVAGGAEDRVGGRQGRQDDLVSSRQIVTDVMRRVERPLGI